MSARAYALITPVCAYCGATDGLRISTPAGGDIGDPRIEEDYICEECFTPSDTGPCFDDLVELVVDGDW